MFEDRVCGSAGGSTDSGARPAAESAPAGGESRARLDSAELIDRLIALRAQAARRDAEMLDLMVEFVTQRGREDVGPGASVSEAFAVDELALALVTTRHRIRQQLGLAQALGGELSATRRLLSAGRIDSYQAWVIFDMLTKLVEPEHVAAVQADIVDRAPDLTGGQIRSRLAKLITATEPEAFAARHEQAMSDRRVSANSGSSDTALDGMGSLWFSHAAVDIAAIDENITRIARAHTSSEDDRSFDNVRADVARDILLGRHQPTGGGPAEPGEPDESHATGERDPREPAPAGDVSPAGDAAPASAAAGVNAQVVVVVPIQTLMGIDDSPAQLLGYGPIPAALARSVASAPDSMWRRMLTDPAGNMVDLSTKTYRPGKVLDLAVTIRDGTSRFPRSNASAVGGDFDHTIPYPNGETSYRNGGKFTRRDHRVKHAPGWTITQPEPGHFTWTTPTGHTYRIGPADQPAGTWPKPWQLDPQPPDLDELMTQLARAPDYLDDQLLRELDIDPPGE